MRDDLTKDRGDSDNEYTADNEGSENRWETQWEQIWSNDTEVIQYKAHRTRGYHNKTGNITKA